MAKKPKSAVKQQAENGSGVKQLLYTIPIWVVLILLAVFIANQNNKAQYPFNEGTITFENIVPQQHHNQIVNDLLTWDAAYNCRTDILVGRLQEDSSIQAGVYVETIAASWPGRIGYTFNRIPSERELFLTTTHEAGHGCKNETIREPEIPLYFTDVTSGVYQVTGFNGLGVRYLATPGGEDKWFTECEEGAVEHLALGIEGYQSEFLPYEAMASFIGERVERQDLANYLWESDFISFTADFYDMSRNQVTVEEVQSLLHGCVLTYLEANEAYSP